MTEKSDIDIVIEWLQARQGDVIATQSDKGLRASGDSASLLRVGKDGEKIGQLIDGSGSFEFQEYGRRPGKFPPLGAIYQWLAFRKYGLNWKTERDRKSLAFAISKKIAKRGTHTHITGKQTGVVTDNVAPEKIDLLMNLIAESKLTQLQTDIKRIFT